MRPARNLSLFALAAALPLVGCGAETSFTTPHDALRAFLDRSIAGDKSGARACLVTAEQPQAALRFDVNAQAGGYVMDDLVELQGDRALVAVQFPGAEEQMRFVLVEEAEGWRVSLGFTLARGMTERVQSTVEDLGDDPSPEAIAEAMRRAMQSATPPRGSR